MTIAPATLHEMIASSRIEGVKAAIAATLARLMKGVSIESYPGRLDINDVLAKAVVAAPGLALGWTRLRSSRDVGGTFGIPVDWIAYIVVEDFADTKAKPARRVGREAVAYGIGAFLLRILADADTPFWGLTGLSEPMPDPAPEMRPVVTMKTAENGAAVYAVTWSQLLMFEGKPLFDGETPTPQPPEGMEFELPEGDVPTELLALFRQGGAP